MREIYMDNASTTFIDKDILKSMCRCYKKPFGANASSVHSYGILAGDRLEECRSRIADTLNCKNCDIIFTSGSTESNNLAILGTASFFKKNTNKNKVIFSSIEHDSVLNIAQKLCEMGCIVEYVNVDAYGIVDIDDLIAKIDKNTFLVSMMLVNNEVGSVQPIKKVGRICRSLDTIFHVDATQAVNNIRINVESLNVDMLSMSAHKFYGPKGVGLLYIRDKEKIDKIVFGGEQENGLRPGTYNLPAIYAMSIALEKAQSNIKNDKYFELSKYFWIKLIEKIGCVKLNGPGILLEGKRIPNIINISFPGVRSESIVTMLNTYGVYVGSGSACSGSYINPSHVLMAMGRNEEEAKEGVRFSFGKNIRKKDIDYTIKCLVEIISVLK